MGVKEKILKCEILKKVFRIAKGTKIWDSLSEELHIYVRYFFECFFEFNLGSFGDHFVFDIFPILGFSKDYCCNSFHSVSTKRYTENR